MGVVPALAGTVELSTSDFLRLLTIRIAGSLPKAPNCLLTSSEGLPLAFPIL